MKGERYERIRDGDEHEQLACAVLRLAHEVATLNKYLGTFMSSLESLQASVNANTAANAELTTSVNAAIAKIGTGTPSNDAEIIALATAVDANTANANALKMALDAAVNPVPPVEPPVE